MDPRVPEQMDRAATAPTVMHALMPCGLGPPGLSGRSPGSQVVTGPRLPGSPQWLPSHGVEGALAAYSDGIAQASHLFPYYPPRPMGQAAPAASHYVLFG